MATLRNAPLLVCFLVVTVAFTFKIENTENETPQYDVIVVGCGASGLAALTRLHAAGVRVLGLEAESRVGGRVNTQQYGSGVAEFGAEWIHGRDGNVVFDFAYSNNITVPAPPELAFDFYLGNGSKPNKEQCDEMSNYLFTTYLNELPAEPRQTMDTFLRNKFKERMEQESNFQNERNFWDSFFSWFSKSIASNDAVDDYGDISTKGANDGTECEGPQNFSWGSRGYWTLFDILLNKTDGNPDGLPIDIKLNKEVVQVNWLPDKPTGVVSVRTGDGSVYTAKTVVLTVSLGVLQHRYKEIFNPALPLAKQSGINLLDMGTINKILLRYDHAWWDKDRVLGLIWSDEDVEALSEDDKWLANFASVTGSEGSPNVLTFWLAGKTARNMESIPLNDLIPKLHLIVNKFFKPHFPNLTPFTELRRTTWSSNPHFRGSYSYHGLRSDVEEDPTEGLREPLLDSGSETPRLLFAGEATHQDYYATVNGALRTGWREADRVLAWRNKENTRSTQ